jgi:hypothetical protein
VQRVSSLARAVVRVFAHSLRAVVAPRSGRCVRAALAAAAVVLFGTVALLADRSSGTASAQVASSAPSAGFVRELAGLRTARSRTFLRSDGSLAARVFAGPVHFRNTAGDWQGIETELVATADGYRNRANSFSAQLPRRIEQSDVRFVADGAWIAFSLRGATATAEVSGESVRYESVLPGVDAVLRDERVGRNGGSRDPPLPAPRSRPQCRKAAAGRDRQAQRRPDRSARPAPPPREPHRRYGRRPSLYVTEFGYFNKPLNSSDLAPDAPGSRKNYWHTEHTRALKLRGQSTSRPGALEVIREGRAKWALLYHLVEYPGQLDAKTGQPVPPGRVPWDSGLVGTPPIITNPDGSRTIGPAAVTGTRSYGKDPNGRNLTRLDFPQGREAYCAIWRWASHPPGEFGSNFPGYYDTHSNECGMLSP